MRDMKNMDMSMKHKGAMMIILGALVLLNVYVMELGWAVFIGGLLVLGGFAKLLHGCCRKGKKRR